MGWLTALYPWIKVMHIVSIISWMAGMFYLPRLFVYHVERAGSGTETDATFLIMEEKLLRIIMRPAMISSWIFGLLLAITPGIVDWGSVWWWLKIASVLGMTATHGWLAARYRDFVAGANTRSGRTYRMMNEVPTLLMLVIVVMVVVRPF